MPKIDPTDIVSLLDTGYESEGDLNTRKMVADINRKKNKSGCFQSMGLSPNVFKGIKRKGYKLPTPIQRKCIPLALQGKDLAAMARTGSGKTAAFLIPMFERLKTPNQVGTRALLLSPTRELAMQTFKFICEIGKFTGLKTALILGGDGMDQQFASMHQNPDIIIATPGRLAHILVEMEFRLNCVEIAVFDEADRLFELGFQDQLNEILNRIPDERQTLLFSATMPKQLCEFAKAKLNDPTLVRLDVDFKLSDKLKLGFLHLRTQEKFPALLHLLNEVFHPLHQTMIFVATKHHVEYVKELLTKCDIPCTYAYSSLDQEARKENIRKFRGKQVRILVVTDVAARGIDIPMLDNVVNFNFPGEPKLFVHRVGRVARAGRIGAAYSLVSNDELPYVIDLHLFLGRPLIFAEEGKSYEEVADSVYGKVASSCLQSARDTYNLLRQDTEVKSLEEVATRAYRHYLRSRKAASTESISRSKEHLQVTDIFIHPLYARFISPKEKGRQKMMESLKNYKCKRTIFEVTATKNNEIISTIKQFRVKTKNAVEKHNEKLDKIRSDINDLSTSHDLPKIKGTEIADDEMKDSFSKIIRPTLETEAKRMSKNSKKRSNSYVVGDSATKKQKTEDFKDEQNYISYKPKDHRSEQGYSISTKQTNFYKDAATVSFDLLGDEDKELRKQRTQQKVWDKKRKKYVNAQDLGTRNNKKKIVTESGAVISSSYKKNLYQEWKKKSKIDDQSNHKNDGSSDEDNLSTKKDFRSGMSGVNNKRWKKKSSQQKSELKRPEQILKQRRLDEEKKSRGRGGSRGGSRGGERSSERGGSRGRGSFSGRGGSRGRGSFSGRGGSRGRGSFSGRGGSRGRGGSVNFRGRR